MPGNGGMGTEQGVMNTLQLIKARATKSRAVELARKQMAIAFSDVAHIDETHTNPSAQKTLQLTYRGVPYTPRRGNQVSRSGRVLRYRGISYGLY